MNNQLIKCNSINKIIVVGHPLSCYQDVETVLNLGGMSPAMRSRRDGFLPAEISATLCKAHRVHPFRVIEACPEIEQIVVSPIWQGAMLDLLLGNIDQELWGWADPQAVYFLDYWKTLDSQLVFMLVYDTPEKMVAQAFDQKTPLTPETLQQATRNWATFNAALLQFYHRNPDRCMLVHAQQVRASASIYLQQMRTRIGAPVLVDYPNPNIDDAVNLVSRHSDAKHQNILKCYIANALLEEQPETLQIYEELQAVANLPLTESAAPASPLDAWCAMVALQTLHTEQLTQAIAQTNVEEEKIKTVNKNLENAKALAGEKKLENELILLQLHQIQEELECHYLEGQEQKEKIKALQAIEKLAHQRAKDIEKLSLEKAKLVAESVSQLALIDEIKTAADKKLSNVKLEFGKAQEEKIAKSQVINSKLVQENKLLLIQLHQVQEELEHSYFENQKLKQTPAKSEKLVKQAYYGAAERIKQQLSYRLGSKMIEHSRSFGGWIGMPFALFGEVRQFKSELPQRQVSKLPPIASYSDATDADRIKQHLSYQLGQALLAQGKNPLRWPLLPFALSNAVKTWKKTR